MILLRMSSRLLLTVFVLLVGVLGCVSVARGAEGYTGPVKENLSSQIEPGGLEFAKGIAVNGQQGSPRYGHVYVIDANHRVQELAGDGSFVSMFGWDVNKTKVEKGGATQQEMNVCTKTEIEAGSECQPGVEGSAPGQFGEAQNSIAIDPVDGAVYVTDFVKNGSLFGERVQKFTAEGVWVWEIGKEVNETKDNTPSATIEEKDLCTQAEVETESVKCIGPALYGFGGEPPANSTEPGVFPIGSPTVVSIGGTEDLLYVGAGQRVQKFDTAGHYKGQIPLAGTIGKIALDDSCELHEPVLTQSTTPTCSSFDPSYGALYLAYAQGGTIIYKLNPNGEQVAEFPLSARTENPEHLFLDALAVDPSGRLAASEIETLREGNNQVSAPFGSLLDPTTGRTITEFRVPGTQALPSLAFSASDALYATIGREVLSYTPVHAAELLTLPQLCVPGADSETDATFDCALNGTVNPEEVPETEAWFQWGNSLSLGKETPVQIICTTPCPITPVPIQATLENVPPNQTVYYRLAAHDQNVKNQELLTSETTSFKTSIVAPRIIGEPTASFITSSSAVLYGELNPENAPTEYYFEYGTELAGYCESALRTKTLKSTAYRKIGATLQATNLQPTTLYKYRLCATNQTGNATDEHGTNNMPEGTFTTAPTPAPQAITGGYSALTTTTATISGTINSDGQPATYTFQLGIYDTTNTHYSTIYTGPVNASTTPTEKTLTLTGLQPGTTYAYRITTQNGYGKSTGTTQTLTTTTLPELPTPTTPTTLPTPPLPFPKPTPPPPHCKHGYKHDKHGKCIKTKPSKNKHKTQHKPHKRQK